MKGPLRALILGPPGGGKGTLSSRLVRDFGVSHISSGDALRQQIASGTAVGKQAEGFISRGDLVPDDVVSNLVLGHMASLGGGVPWLLDGFPRTLAQAHTLDTAHDINLVLNLEIPEAEILSRLGGRRVHVASGRSYHLVWNPPATEGVDDVTGEPLEQRPDDTDGAILERLAKYHELTHPLVEHYGARGLLTTFAGTESNVIYPEMHAHVTGLGVAPLASAK